MPDLASFAGADEGEGEGAGEIEDEDADDEKFAKPKPRRDDSHRSRDRGPNAVPTFAEAPAAEAPWKKRSKGKPDDRERPAAPERQRGERGPGFKGASDFDYTWTLGPSNP